MAGIQASERKSFIFKNRSETIIDDFNKRPQALLRAIVLIKLINKINLDQVYRNRAKDSCTFLYIQDYVLSMQSKCI